MIYIIKKLLNMRLNMQFTKKQLEKMADQARLLSWAQGAIITSTSGFNVHISAVSILGIVINFIILQMLGLFFDKRSDQ